MFLTLGTKVQIPANSDADRTVTVLEAFGFGVSNLEPSLFLAEDRVSRMGLPPMLSEILTSVSDVNFDDCYAARLQERWDDAAVDIISLEKLKDNKRAGGRLQDLVDLEHLR